MKKICFFMMLLSCMSGVYLACDDTQPTSQILSDPQMESLVSKLEFQEYLLAEMALYQEIVAFDKAIHQTHYPNASQREDVVFDMSKYYSLKSKHAILLDEFPDLAQANPEILKQSVISAINTNPSYFQYQLLNDFVYQIPMTKDFSFESDGLYNFVSQEDAFLAAWEWSSAQSKECIGYRINGTYYLILDSSATINHYAFSWPENGSEISLVFHTHPGGTPSMSHQDSLSMMNYLPSGWMYVIFGSGQYECYGPFI